MQEDPASVNQSILALVVTKLLIRSLNPISTRVGVGSREGERWKGREMEERGEEEKKLEEVREGRDVYVLCVLRVRVGGYGGIKGEHKGRG